MNRKSALTYLRNILAAINCDHHVQDEILAIISHSGIEKQFFMYLSRYVSLLLQLGVSSSVQLHEVFEQLDDNLYRMRVMKSPNNIRIIYGFVDDKPILLHCFYEREGKSNTDYTEAIKIASARLAALKGESL